MKKINLFVLVIFLVTTAIGCKIGKNSSSVPKDDFSLTDAKNQAGKYMDYIYKEDYKNAKDILSEDMQKSLQLISTKETKMTGYQITEVDEVGRSAEVKVRVATQALKSPFAELDEYSLKVSKVKGKYQIEKIENETQKEAFKSGDSIRMRIKGNGKSVLLVDRDSLPQYGFSKDDKVLLTKIPLQGYEFGIMTFSFSGSKILIDMEKNNSFLCLASIDDSIETQGSSQGSQNGGSTNFSPREKPAGKEVVALDVLINSKITKLAISEDERFVCAQYASSNGVKCIRVYNSQSGEMVPVNFEKSYDISKNDIIFQSFDKDFMIFDIVPKKEISSKESNSKWQMNLKSFKIERIS